MEETEKVTFTLRASPTLGKLAEAMAKAQLEMNPASKDSFNPHYKNKYASLAACFEAGKPMHKYGLAVFQPPALHGPDGVCVQTLVVHGGSGEWLLGELYMPASKKDPQGFGSALTYARRYSYCSTIGLPVDDDDAEEASRGHRRSEPKTSFVSPEPSADEKAIADAFDLAQTTADIAAAEAKAHKAIGEKKIVNGGRERLLKRRAQAIARIGASQ